MESAVTLTDLPGETGVTGVPGVLGVLSEAAEDGGETVTSMYAYVCVCVCVCVRGGSRNL